MKQLKSKLAGFLAAVMVCSLAAPSTPAYGNPEHVQFIFITGNGPGIENSTYHVLPYNGSEYFIAGPGGSRLIDDPEFGGVPTEMIGDHLRPKLPEFNADVQWDGYILDGWYVDGERQTKMPIAYPHAPKMKTYYEAKWKGDPDRKFDFKVMHYRDLNADRDNNNDGANPAAWPSETDAEVWRFFDNVSSENSAGDSVLTVPRSDIPGYRIKSTLIKNNHIKGFGVQNPPTGSTGEASLDPSTHQVRGKMPNDNLTVAYRYEPNPERLFDLTVRYVDESGGTVQAPVTSKHAAETEISATPVNTESHVLLGGSVTRGTIDDMAGQGIYSADTAGCEITGALDGYKFSGKMPNQNVTVTYTYKVREASDSEIVVKCLDPAGVEMEEYRQEIPLPSNLEEIIRVPIPRIDAYKPPNVTVTEGITVLAQEDALPWEFNIKSDYRGGTVTFRYSHDYENTDIWQKVVYYSGPNGSFKNTPVPKYVQAGNHPIETLTTGIEPVPSEGYMLDGWYRADALGQPVGPKLEGGVTVEPPLSNPLKLYAKFKEAREHVDITFHAGENGRLQGNNSIRVVKGSHWRSLEKPEPIPEPADRYEFAGWYDAEGNKMPATNESGNPEINENQQYTARFKAKDLVDDNLLVMPDVRSTIVEDGSGTITVNGPNADRKYAVTDMNRKVAAEVQNGITLNDRAFIGLYPGTAYKVYELAQSIDPVPQSGSILQESAYTGPPAVANVPVIGSNYTTEEDPATGLMSLNIQPAAQDTLYALLDEEGSVVMAPGVGEVGENNGWLTPQPAAANTAELACSFTRLKPNAVYVVVAKHVGENESPEEKLPLGSQISLISTSTPEEKYTLELENGGYIESINGEPLESGESPYRAAVEAGTVIAINAPDGTGGEAFTKWETLIGNLTIPYPERPDQPITMPADNVVIQATYPGENTPGNATVDYTPKDGKTALDLSGDRRDQLLDALLSNAEDIIAMEKNWNVDYMVKFNRRIPLASEANAVLDQLEGEPSVKTPWVLTSSLSRKVAGATKELAEGGYYDPPVRILSAVDNSMMGYLDYRLWKEENGTYIEVDMEVPSGDSGFTGTIVFEGEVGGKYMLSYSKAHMVTVIDGKRGSTHRIKVKTETALEDADGYGDLDIFADYTDPLTGIVYENRGLGKELNSSAGYDTTSPVTNDLKLYIQYQEADDSQWQAARQKLIDKIAVARALMYEASTSEADKQALQEAVTEAEAVANRLPRPSIEELKQTYERLKTLVDSIRGYEDPDDDNDDDNNDDDDDNHGGGGGGGGGGGRGGGRAAGPGFTFNRYKTYRNGFDGDWVQAEAAGGRWFFVLKNGMRAASQWVNIKYEDARQTYTYHFNNNGTMDTGWFMDEDGNWYLLDTVQGPNNGRLMLEWQWDTKGNWYYFNEFTGSMMTGWKQLGEDWYYFADTDQANRPKGAMYQSQTTPDGYSVDADGKWIRETP